LKTLIQDLVYALRQLRNAPAFTVTAVLTLALGIGANTAVFTLVHEVLLKSLPVSDPSGLYRLGDKYECCVEGGLQEDWTMFSYPLYQYLRDHTPEYETLAASQTNRPDLSVRRQGAGTAENFSGELVSGNYFSTLGLRAFAGRLVSPNDDQAGAPPVAVMSYRAWEQKYGLDSSLVGQSMTINGIPMTLVGIAPPGFYGDRRESDPPDFWMPISIEPTLAKENSLLHSQTTNWLYLIGRLRPGVSSEAVSAHLTTELRQYLQVPGNLVNQHTTAEIAKEYIKVTPGGGGVNAMEDEYRQGLYLLLGAALAILLIACANVANLLLARGAAARFRTSLQLAIGASRARIIRAGLTESILLAVVGGVAGVLLAYHASQAMVLLAFRGAKYVPLSTSPSWPVLLFAFAVTMLTGIIFGVGPAWIASRSDPADTLRGASRATRDSATTGQKALVVLQAALSLVLLCVAGLVTQSLRHLRNQEYGFDRGGRMLVEINPAAAGYTKEKLAGLYQQMEDRFKATPGVISESLALYTPQQGNNWGETIEILGRENQKDQNSSWDRVSAHYFETLGTPIIEGRGFKESDTQTAQHVAVVNESFAKKFFPNASALGQHFGKGDDKSGGDYEIVGVAKNVKYWTHERDNARPMFFVPLPQTTNYTRATDERVESGSMYMGTIILHVAGDPNAFQGQIRNTLSSIDPNLTPLSIRTYDEQLEVRASENVLISRLSGLFGLLALLLASIGLYGLTAYQVARRTSEIGLRMALGADRFNILRMVMKGAFLQVAIGLAIGIPLVFLSGKWLAHQLYGVGAFEPVILIGAIVVLAGCAFISSILPARRAAGTDPMKALRTE
jgi:predicted permease